MGDEDVVAALAHASRVHDPYAANILATEAHNRLAQRQRWLDLVEAFYHVHDLLGIGLIIVDGGRPYYANDAFRALVGRTLDDLVSMVSLLELVDPADRARIEKDFREMIAGLRPMERRRTRLLCVEREPVPVEVLVAPVRSPDPDGPPRLVCVVRPLNPSHETTAP